MKFLSLLFFTGIFLLSSDSLLSQIIYITPDGTGIGTKESPAGIEDAFTNLSGNGVHFRLSTGTYNISNELLINHDNVTIEGGFQADKLWAKTSEVGATTINRLGINLDIVGALSYEIIGIQVANGVTGLRMSDLEIRVQTPDASLYALTSSFGVSNVALKLNQSSNYILNRLFIDVLEPLPTSGSFGNVHSYGISATSNGPNSQLVQSNIIMRPPVNLGVSQAVFFTGQTFSPLEGNIAIEGFPIVEVEETIDQLILYTLEGQNIAPWVLPSGTPTSKIATSSFPNVINDITYDNNVYSDFIIVPQSSICPSGAIVYVDQNATGNNDGSSWADAFVEMSEAVDVANVCSIVTDIYVAKGSYKPSRLSSLIDASFASFTISKNLNIYGGFLGGETDPSQRELIEGKLNPENYAVFNGDLNGNDFYDTNGKILEIVSVPEPDNTRHVFRVVEPVTLILFDGIEVMGGHARGDNLLDYSGGGIAVLDEISLPVNVDYQNCIFRSNIANIGAGVFHHNGVISGFENCGFLSNISNWYGGGMANYSQTAVFDLVVSKSYFKGNISRIGGAIYNHDFSNSMTNVSISQNIFSGNSTVNNASCIYQLGGIESNVINNTFAGNINPIASQDLFSAGNFYNNIVYGNQTNPNSLITSSTVGIWDRQYNLIEDFPPSSTIYNFDPGFVDPYLGSIPNTLGDYRVDPLSPSINKGSNDLYNNIGTLSSTDFDDNPRFQNPIILSESTLVIDLGPWEALDPLDFTATQDVNDAFIDLSWTVEDLDCRCLEEDPNLKLGVTVSLKEGAQLIDSWTVFKEEAINGIYTFNYRDFVGPGITKDYTLDFKKTGPGTLNCSRAVTGSTAQFVPPVIISIDNSVTPDSVNINWTNNSTLTSGYNIYREGAFQKFIPASDVLGIEYDYSDVFGFNTSSFVNGDLNEYCIETQSNIYFDIYGDNLPQQTCSIGSTFDIGFEATDNVYSDRVTMTWNDVSAYASQIRVVRDGRIIGVLDALETTYEDLAPIHGKNCEYGVELINDNTTFVGNYDNGMVPSNGKISGLVLSSQEKIPVADVKIVLSWTEQDSMLSDSTLTDHTGAFLFEDLFYGELNNFALTASKDGESFVINPLETELQSSQPEQSDLVFLMDKDYDKADTFEGFGSFTGAQLPLFDAVGLSFNYTKDNPTDTLFFNIYRESNLIYQGVDINISSVDYTDFGGVPDSTYDYTIHAYQITNNGIVDTTLTTSVTFPEVARVETFSSNIRNDLGYIELSWAHTSNNNSGFRINRVSFGLPNELVYDGDSDIFNFNSLEGVPGEAIVYQIKAYREVNGIVYESLPNNIGIGPPGYPELTPVNITSASNQFNTDFVGLRYEVPSVYVSGYNFDGLKVYRTLVSSGVKETIGIIENEYITPGPNKLFSDITGIPEAMYLYEINAYKTVSGFDFEVEGIGAVVTYPPVSVPENLTQGPDAEGKVELLWSNNSLNRDGFIVYKGTNSIDSIGYVLYDDPYRFVDYTTNPPSGSPETYHVATARFVNGVRYISDTVSLVTNPPLINGGENVDLKNFVASKDQANLIKLCWEWCDPATQTPFVIRREGVVIDTVSFETLAYYDYDAPQGREVEYSIETPGIDDQLNFQWVYTSGLRPSFQSISGRVYYEENNIGIPNLNIVGYVFDPNQTSNFLIFNSKTSAAGFYQVMDMPHLAGLDTVGIRVDVRTQGQSLDTYVKIFNISQLDSIRNYTVDFIGHTNDLNPENNIANIVNFAADPDPGNLAMQLSWSPDNQNFDGFEVSRGTEFLGEVLKGSSLTWTDTDGVPGVITSYAVRAFKIENSVKVFGPLAYSGNTFPLLQAVENLGVTSITGNNRMSINWTHPYDMHDFYTVTRDGIPFDVIKTGSRLEVVDSTGVPGANYSYEVIAWKGNVQSQPKSIEITYSDIEPIRSFELKTDSINVALTLENIVSEFLTLNYLKLNWSYQSEAADSFLVNRYIQMGSEKFDEQILAKVDGDTYEYIDDTGIPDQVYYYEVIPILNRDGDEYFAQRRDFWSENKQFPSLAPPYYYSINPISEMGVVRGFYTLADTLSDGQKFYRDNQEIIIDSIVTQDDVGFSFNYLEKGGSPGSSHTYKIKNYKKFVDFSGTEIEKESVEIAYTVTYPLPPIPLEFNASNGTFTNKVRLTWDYNLDVPVDNFVIERKLPNDIWLPLVTLTPGFRRYEDYITGNGLPDGYFPIEYRIKAVNKSISSAWVENTGSLYSGIIPEGIVGANRELGLSLEVSGDWAVAGTNGLGFHIYHLQDDNTWALHEKVELPFNGIFSQANCFGCEVSVSGNYLAVSAKNADQNAGQVFIFELGLNDEWILQETLYGVNNGYTNFGNKIDIYDDTNFGGKDELAVAYDENKVGIFKRVGSNWELEGTIIGNVNRQITDLTIDQRKLAFIENIAAENRLSYYYISTAGTANLITSGTLDADRADLKDGKLFVNSFGFSRGIIYEATNIGLNILYNTPLVTGRDVALGEMTASRSDVNFDISNFVDNSGSWSSVTTISPDPSLNQLGYGLRMSMTDDFIMTSSYLFNNRLGNVVFIPNSGTIPPVNVNASKGTNPGQVLISWEEPNDLSQVSSYKVFRDGELLSAVSSVGPPGNLLTYTDLPSSGLVPGKHYTYQVQSTYGNLFSKPIGDEGWQPENGMISGQLTTLQGGVPIEGATVSAEFFIDDSYLTFETMTDVFGQYQINDIYYGESSIVRVTCEYLDHEIVSQTSANVQPPINYDDVELTIANNTNTNTSFFDKTAYTISGFVKHKDIDDCFLDSIRVKRTYSVLQNGNRVRQKEEKFTDGNGEFSFVIDPELIGMDSLLIEVENIRYLNDENGMPQDSICYDFESVLIDNSAPYIQNDHPDGHIYITDFSNINLNSQIAFEDQTLYPSTIEIVNTCGDALLSPSENWTIRVTSRDGCFERYITTTNGRSAFAEVPPLDLVYTVTDVSNKTIQNLVYLDYLINNSGTLQVDSLHIKESKELSQSEIIDRLTLQLEYHNPPIVTPDFSEFEFLCDDPTRQAIIDAGSEYTIPVAVAENFGTLCSATSGYVKVINAASNSPEPVILNYIDSLGSFEDYNFTAGSPNPVVPHRWNIKFEYYTDGDLFQGEYSHEVFVRGSINLPGNGILVDASDDVDVVPLPLYVLRDPPGDGSSATIEEGYTSTSVFSFAENTGGSGAVLINTGFAAFGIGFEDEFNFEFGSYNEDSRELSITTTTTKNISTSSDNDLVGRDASIVVGLGVAMQFGLVSAYDIECIGTDEGRVTETISQGFTPVEVKTTFTYTIKFIEDLINGYNRQIDSIISGQLVLNDSNGVAFTQEEAIDKFESLRDNWIQIINYFDYETNPIVHVLSSDYEDATQYQIVGALNAEANKWRSALISDFVSGSSPFDPTEILDQNKIDKYNNAATAIRELINVTKFADPNGSIPPAIVEDIFNKWHFTSARYADLSYYITGGQATPFEMADNLTFSGGTTQSFSYGQDKSFTLASNRSSFFKTSYKLQAVFGTQINVQVAPFGVGTETKAVDVNNKIGGKIEFGYTSNSGASVGNTVSQQISYTLSDNEAFDQVSTTILRGIQPTHTPFFQVVGGETSCPWEEGTLQVDNPIIQVLDPKTGNVGIEASLPFQDPDQFAEFTIRITNKSSTGDDRDVTVFLDNTSNPNGATLRLNGQIIGAQNYSLLVDQPLDLTLSVERGFAYDYEGLRIGIQPACSSSGMTEFVTLNVDFQSPCSPVSIVKPDDNWLINGQNRDLVIGLRDYEPSTPNFESLTLQYRKLGEGVTGGLAFVSGWDNIPYTSIKETSVNNNPVLPITLDTFNTNNFTPAQTPTYFMVWEPEEGNASLFPDGDYELRVVATCEEDGVKNFTYSNVISGKIDRSSLQIFGTPEPADGVWAAGDEVSISFNGNINCNLLDDPDFLSDSLRVYVDDVMLNNTTFTCLNNKIIMTVPDFSIYDGKIMTVSVENISNDNGNFAIKTDEFGNTTRKLEWSFLVTTSKAYWEQDSIVVTVYEGDTVDIMASLRNADISSLNNLSISRTTASGAWLDIEPSGSFGIIPGGVEDVTLSFIGVSEGTTYDTLSVSNLPGNGIIPSLPVKLITVKRPVYPPDYEFDTNLFPNSMTVVANYMFEDVGELSTDTLDQITVWIDNELRGLGRVEQSGENFIAYLTVYGGNSDSGKTLEFRVWNREMDKEYSAFTNPEIIYSDNDFEGTTFNPRILVVDRLADEADYIYLNQGYTWISFNRIKEDMSSESILGTITNPTPGDRVLSQDRFIEYVDGVGWFADSSVKLDTIRTDAAYMVYLQNGPDSIRITGDEAQPFSEYLMAGTNWVGFPSQINLLVEDAIGVNNLVDVTQIKNKDVSRLSNGTSWTSGQLLEMQPHEGYKLFLDNIKPVTIPGTNPQPLHDPNALGGKSLSMIPDPYNASTWILDLNDYAFTDVVPVVGQMQNQGIAIPSDGIKKVAAFINGTLRGTGNIEYLPELSSDLFTVFIGKDDIDNSAEVKFFYFDGTAVNDSLVIGIGDIVSAGGHGIYNYETPLILDVNSCPETLTLTSLDSPLDGLYQASQVINIQGVVEILNGANVILSAPEVNVIELETEAGAVLEVLQTGCN